MSDFDELMRIQRMMASRLMQEADTDNQIRLLDIIRDVGGAKKRVPVEKVLLEARMQGLTDSEVMRILEQLKRDGLLDDSEQGYVKLT